MLSSRTWTSGLSALRPLERPHLISARPLPGRPSLQQRLRVPAASESAYEPDAAPAGRKLEAQKWIKAWRDANETPAPVAAAPESAAPASASSMPAPIATPTPEPKVEVQQSEDPVKQYLLLWSGLGAFYTADYFSKKAFVKAGITFPSSLVGMFVITAVLIAMGEKNAAAFRGFFTPALNWIGKWLPIFYVASLVCLPLALTGLSNNELLKILGILGVGMVMSLIFTAQITGFIRSLVKTQSKDVVKAKKSSPFLAAHQLTWGAIAALSLAATVYSPSGLGPMMALPFMLACTICGFLFGNAVPSQLQGILHPVITTALAGNASAAIYASAVGISYEVAQKIYYAKGAGPMGAGDLLSSFLGSVILSMGFRIYDERETMKRHAPEILGATFLSSLFNMFSTAFLAKAVGLQALLARALIPRSVTVALALPIGVQLDAPLSIVAAAVLLHCLLAANFCIALLNAIGCKDTISRGLAAAGTGGGFGTAALTSKEPEAMPFCALAYSMVGIFSTVLASVPWIRQLLFSITG